MTRRILVVDDEANVAFFIREGLAELGAGYEIETASSGEEALRKMAESPFDMVIADLRMPGMNGLELLYRTQRRYPGTHLILMTAYGNEKVRDASRRLQVYRYITKPFRMEELINAVRAAFGGYTVNTRGVLILSDERFNEISRRLDELRNDTGAQAVLLCDVMGQIIVNVGEVPELNLHDLAALVAGGVSTTLEMRRLLGERHALNLNYHEGDRFDVYSSTVGETLFLLFIFDRRVRPSRIGLVWLTARRAISNLEELTATEEVPAEEVLGEEFGETLLQEVDELFKEDGGGLSLEEATAALAAEVEALGEDSDTADEALVADASSLPSSEAEAQATREADRIASKNLLSFEEAVKLGLVPKDLVIHHLGSSEQ